MGVGEYEGHVGYWDAVDATVLGPTPDGVAWVHQRKGRADACLIRIERAGPDSLIGRATVAWNVSPVAGQALAAAERGMPSPSREVRGQGHQAVGTLEVV
jgi:hypothetical protein